MIPHDLGLEQTRRALASLEGALMGLKQNVLPQDPARFALMAEPVVDHIRQLRREIEDYVGYTFAVAQQAVPEIARMLDGEGSAYSEIPASAHSAH